MKRHIIFGLSFVLTGSFASKKSVSAQAATATASKAEFNWKKFLGI